MANVTVKLLGKDMEINSDVKIYIEEIVEKTMSLSEVKKKSDDIGNNIRNNYYYAKKYISMPLHLTEYRTADTLTAFGEMFDVIEEMLNRTSVPREYENDKETAKKYLKHIVTKYNRLTQTDDTWEKDFQKMHEISDSLMSAIHNVINEGSVDEYNKPSFAEDVLDAINIGISESLLKTIN